MSTPSPTPPPPSEVTVLELSSECTCQWCPGCELGFDSAGSHICPECTAPTEPAPEHWECGEFERECFTSEWEERFRSHPFRFSDGSPSPELTPFASAGEMLKLLLTPGSRITATFGTPADPGASVLTVLRYSHDEPTGTRFELVGLSRKQGELFSALCEDVEWFEDTDVESFYEAALAVLTSPA